MNLSTCISRDFIGKILVLLPHVVKHRYSLLRGIDVVESILHQPTDRRDGQIDGWTHSYINARMHLKMIEIGNFRKEMLHTKPPPGHGGRGLAVMTKIAPIIMKFGIESTSIISR